MAEEKVVAKPVQEVSVPVVRGIEAHIEATFTQGDTGELAENAKFADIRTALEGVSGLENVKVTHFKAKSVAQTQKDAEKDEKAFLKAEKEAAEEA